ncbi:hypothetical protein PtA15_18A400 [Puccinia triticina]|uniref:Uncharacterized protein n=1 Tax=Puccinia triticina TaxID=208348 RepID=A0ABY7D7W2_9BASI|nr:uncharacterized protein PtA15_18A400 [Puccinia triticina]WAQ93340.1 hypothetical protein PtA15_18A400 [Puccinia triticina]WAR63339.1 hypothetical protein PtB15_18B422 [Puccinia triticina]
MQDSQHVHPTRAKPPRGPPELPRSQLVHGQQPHERFPGSTSQDRVATQLAVWLLSPNHPSALCSETMAEWQSMGGLWNSLNHLEKNEVTEYLLNNVVGENFDQKLLLLHRLQRYMTRVNQDTIWWKQPLVDLKGRQANLLRNGEDLDLMEIGDILQFGNPEFAYNKLSANEVSDTLHELARVFDYYVIGASLAFSNEDDTTFERSVESG